MAELGEKLAGTTGNWKRLGLCVAGCAALIAFATEFTGFIEPAVAAPISLSRSGRSASLQATTSDAARRDAKNLIPLEKLAAEDRAKVDAVLSNTSVFRRMPVRVIDCDPDFYLFLVRHPDVMVNIWEVLRISGLRLREADDNQFWVSETDGATVVFQFVYESHDLHVVYGEGVYRGSLLPRPVKGRGVLVLKSGYIRDANGRSYITSRMDSFLSVEPAGAELVTKTISPVLGKTVDNNFVQTLGFMGSLSRTAEVNGRGVQRLGEQLTHVQPGVREQFAALAATVSRKRSETMAKGPPAKIASQPAEESNR